ncbi:uncharacterized protein HaLaN_13460 [Haematococcus lacustris]|uniref:DNA-directed RNA polymerase III subunit RPC3 n=1 Tax=Haematococcus lacustris TaxID=44745 RepID=A0A699ZD80_HAELA|nr:uncharacterized protein HaLaN_13460 [Haematococcus lacustris]
MSSNTVNQWAMRLAYHLIRVYHGDISEKLCMKLASRGRQSLPDLIRASEMPASQVKQALLLLIQHNYVVVYCIKEEEEGQRGPPKPPQYLYEARVAEMLLILRSMELSQSSSCGSCWTMGG